MLATLHLGTLYMNFYLFIIKHYRFDVGNANVNNGDFDAIPADMLPDVVRFIYLLTDFNMCVV
jgi:hypothetical protein